MRFQTVLTLDHNMLSYTHVTRTQFFIFESAKQIYFLKLSDMVIRDFSTHLYTDHDQENMEDRELIICLSKFNEGHVDSNVKAKLHEVLRKI